MQMFVKEYLLLIIVLIQKVKSNHSMSVESEIERLSKYCNSSDDSWFNNIENSNKFKLLGEGGFGKVYAQPNNKVAKIITLEKGNKAKDVRASHIKAIIDEIIFMKFYQDKNKTFKGLEDDDGYNPKKYYLLKLYGCNYTLIYQNNEIFQIKIALELERLSNDLAQFLKNNTDINVVHLIDITRHIIRGLYQIHQYGYAHLDLKAENIMMRDPFDPVIIDFGLVYPLVNTKTPLSLEQIKSKVLQNGPVCGTPLFIDPKMYENEVSFYSDVYSLGVMLHEYFNSNINVNKYVDKKAQRYRIKFDTLIRPRLCEKLNVKCPYQGKEYSKVKYFVSLIHWMLRYERVNRIYLDMAMEKLYDMEKQYYNDCRFNRNQFPGGICFTSRIDYRKYRNEKRRQYNNRGPAKKMII